MSQTAELIERCRSLGETRLQIARESKSPAEWEKKWRQPQYSFPFNFGEWWTMTVEYQVQDYAAEVGFYTDILSFPINALDRAYAMFTGPNEEFHISVSPCPIGDKPTPPNAFKLVFMVKDLKSTAAELRQRGVLFEMEPSLFGGPGTNFLTGFFRTPHGIRIALWSMVEIPKAAPGFV